VGGGDAGQQGYVGGGDQHGVRALIREGDIGGGLDGRGAQHAGRRLWASALGFAVQAPQQAGELLDTPS
jgi:hypothetical protein